LVMEGREVANGSEYISNAEHSDEIRPEEEK
jgi:hypothetical protein